MARHGGGWLDELEAWSEPFRKAVPAAAVQWSSRAQSLVALTAEGPRLLLAEHLEGDRPILIFRVDSLDAAVAELEKRGVELGSRFEMPYGSGIGVPTPGPQRLALYERTRQERGDSLAGRKDF